MRKTATTYELTTPTEKEIKLIDYLNNCIGDWIEKNETDRRDLIAALFVACQIVFCEQTRFNLKAQYSEIDDFCRFLKEGAKSINKKMNTEVMQ